MALYQYCIGGHVQPNTQNWHFHHVCPLFLFGRRRIKYALDYQQWKSYVEIIGNNQMITTAYIDRAHTFNNKKTAEKYCSLLPKAMKNLKYKVIFISNPDPKILICNWSY